MLAHPERINETTTSHDAENNKMTVEFNAPVNGKFKSLVDVDDEVFSKKMMGEGFAIEPSDQHIFSPVEGEVVSIFKTKHAIGLKTKDGLEVLLHMGIDTVDLAGKPFTIKVKEGEKVSPQTELAEVDLEQIKASGKKTTIITVITNAVDHVIQAGNDAKTGDEIHAQDNVYHALVK